MQDFLSLATRTVEKKERSVYKKEGRDSDEFIESVSRILIQIKVAILKIMAKTTIVNNHD